MENNLDSSKSNKKQNNNYNKNIVKGDNFNCLKIISEIAPCCDSLVDIKSYYHNENNELIYLTEEFENRNLQSIIDDKIKFDKDTIDNIIFQVAEALEVLHDNNIVHRGVHPSNILVCKDSIVRLIGYDVAACLDDVRYANAGTKGFAAPEQFGFDKLDSQADIYGFGKTIELLVANCSDEVFEYNYIIERSTSLEKEKRFASVKEIIKIISNNHNRFFPTQIMQIEKGRDLGLTDEQIKTYAVHKFNAKQMGVIKHCLHEKLDIDVLNMIVDGDFSSRQMYQIKEGWKDNLTINQIKSYSKKYYHPEDMAIYRNSILNKRTEIATLEIIKFYNSVIKLHEFSLDQLKAIRYAIYLGLQLNQLKIVCNPILSYDSINKITKILLEENNG